MVYGTIIVIKLEENIEKIKKNIKFQVKYYKENKSYQILKKELICIFCHFFNLIYLKVFFIKKSLNPQI